MDLKRKLLLLLWLLSLGFSVHALSRPGLSYVFTRKDSSALSITLIFSGNSKGTSRLLLPTEWAGQQKLYHSVSELKALSRATRLLPTDTPWVYTVSYPPGTNKVIISYTLRQDWSGPLRNPQYFRAVIGSDAFYFPGYSGLVYPEISREKLLDCRVTYRGFPTKDFLGNSFFAESKSRRFQASIADLRNSIYCAGDYRFRKMTTSQHKTILIAIRGRFAFRDEEVYRTVGSILLYERNFWKDRDDPYFFTVLQVMPGNNSTGGTGFLHSFAMFQSASLPFNPQMSWLIAHENFHTWLGQRMAMPEPEELSKWFSEGFTDYYAYKVLHDTHLLTDQDFVAKLNEIIQTYYLNPFFNTPNSGIIGKYWSDANIKQLSYQRGTLIAFLLEQSLFRSHFTLDSLLRKVYKQSAPGFVFSKVLFDRLVNTYAGSRLLAVIDSTNNGNNEPLTKAMLALTNPAMRQLTIDKIFDLGFDLSASTETHRINSVRKGSTAEKAGLRDGQSFTGGVSIYYNDLSKPAKVQLLVDGKKQIVEFFPVRDTVIRIPQIAEADPKVQLLNALDSFKIALNDRWSYRYANNANYDMPIESLRQKIKKGISIDQFGVEIEKILALGIDGHSRIRGYAWPEGACLPFLLEADDDKFIAINPDRNAFLIDGFPFLTKIDGKPIHEWYAKAAARVPKGSAEWVKHRSIVRFMGRLDYWREEFGLLKKETVTVELSNASGSELRVLNLAVAKKPVSYPVWPNQTSKLLTGNIGYLRLPNMQKEPSINEIKSWMPKFKRADGLIIDVRDNDGGERDALNLLYSYIASPVSKPHVFNAAAYRLHPSRKDDYLAGYSMYTKDSEKWDADTKTAIKEFKKTFRPQWQLPKGQFSQWHYAVLRRNPDPDIYYFDKPVVVLMNAKCFSAADVFLAGLKGVANITLIGAPSGGGSGNNETLKLGTTPIELTISTMASFQSNGKLFDGNGVQPDILVNQAPEYQIGGHDNLLDRAMSFIKEHKK